MCNALKFALGSPLFGIGVSWLFKIILVTYVYDDGSARVGFIGFLAILSSIAVGAILVARGVRLEK